MSIVSIFGPNLVARNQRNQPRAFSDRGRLSIVRNLQEQSARFRKRACADRAQIYCVCACVWRRSRSRSVQRRSHQRSRRVNWFRAREYTGRARACTHQEQRRRGRRERRKSSERASEKEGKRRGKGKRSAERSFASRVRSWRANV